MGGIIITDETEDNLLAVNLLDILRLLEPLALKSQWDISNLECFGNSADELYQLTEAKMRVPGSKLLQIAAELTQVVNGVFSGYFQDESKPWIIIRAVDSFAYEVQTENEELLVQIRQHFNNVSDIPMLPQEKVTLQQLKEWAQAQISNIIEPAVSPDIGVTVLQLIDEFEQLQNRVKQLEKKQ